jgi:hypothetical protein
MHRIAAYWKRCRAFHYVIKARAALLFGVFKLFEVKTRRFSPLVQFGAVAPEEYALVHKAGRVSNKEEQ